MKYYVIWEGKRKGIFDSWDECKTLVVGCKGAKYKGFDSMEKAKLALSEGYEKYYTAGAKQDRWKNEDLYFEKNSISVDAACSGNPGAMEYRGVDLQSCKEIFKKKFNFATNNIGEFLAIVRGLAYLNKMESDKAIYSDSKHAMNRVLKGKCRTKLTKDEPAKAVFVAIKEAEKWLKNNSWDNEILKWNTKEWGEIPADFGRK